MKETGDTKLYERVATLETTVPNMDKNITKIMENHLPHLQSGLDKANEKIDKINLRLAYYIGGGTVLLAGLQIYFHFR